MKVTAKQRSKFIVSLALTLALTIASCPMNQVFAAANGRKRYVVIPKDGYFQTIRDRFYDRISAEISTVLTAVSGKLLTLELTAWEAFGLESIFGIAAVDEDIDVIACADETGGESAPEWNMQMIHADAAEQTSSSQKVKVMIIDSGIDDTDDISVKERRNFVPGEEEVYACFDDTTGHGTSIAGIIASTGTEAGCAGINPNVELYSAKIFDFSMSAPVSRVAEAIYWAIEQDVNIINLSFGTTQNNEALHAAVKVAYDAGILIVAAAGNNGTVEYPAAYPEVMAVGSVNSQGEPAEATAQGAALEVTAPGERIASTSHFGGVAVASGTSLAAPHVVGAASVLWQKDLSKSNEFIRTVLKASANADEGTAFGYGTIDLAYALEVYEQLKDVEIAPSTPADTDTLMEENGVTENPNTIETTENDYVEGRWNRNNHQLLIETDENDSNFNDSTTHQILLTCLKRGTRANDTYIPGMADFPELHGYAYCNNGINNYVFSYLLLIDLAQFLYTSYGTGATFSVSDSVYANAVLGADSNQTITTQARLRRTFDSLTDRITTTTLVGYNRDTKQDVTLTWQQVFTGGISTQPNQDNSVNSLGTPNGAKVCAFVYGMAAHIMADTFAHSTWAKQDGQNVYSHIIHDNDHQNVPGDPDNKYTYDADDPNYFPNRWDCATEAVGNVVDHYYTNSSDLKTDGSIADYVLTSYDGSFQLRYLYEYVLQASNGTASNNTLTPTQKAYFTRINNTPS